MREGIAVTAFTQRGRMLAESLCTKIGDGQEPVMIRSARMSLRQWTEEQFPVRRALVFIGAAGIAVRAIAPFLKNKADDPAVIVMDEAGHFVISLASGHLGGANELALQIAKCTGAEPVITTATDLNHAFAVDLWAKKQHLQVLQPGRIRNVSGKILRGETIVIAVPWEISGQPPENVVCMRYAPDASDDAASAMAEQADAVVTIRPWEGNMLHLVPRVLTLGIGCRRGTAAETLEAVFQQFCRKKRICPEAFKQAASIDLKADEEGLLAFCREHGWPVSFFEAGELEKVQGTFSGSSFVKKTTGVDNVCERSAIRASGGRILEQKYAADGVTLAAALEEPLIDWKYASASEDDTAAPAKIVVFGGTMEGRELSERLAGHGAQVVVCVASEYGREIQGFQKDICVRTGPLTAEEKETLLKEALLCVDATHPYASHVTQSVQKACEKAGVRYLRLLRDASREKQGLCVEDAEAAAAYLQTKEGNILLTTGAKELPVFCSLDKNRLYVRVLPTADNLKLCEELGIPRKNVIAMQGPFTRDMNTATIRQYQISFLVTKDGGVPGGFPEKAEAAEETGIEMIVLKRPEETATEAGMNYEETLQICLRAIKDGHG